MGWRATKRRLWGFCARAAAALDTKATSTPSPSAGALLTVVGAENRTTEKGARDTFVFPKSERSFGIGGDDKICMSHRKSITRNIWWGLRGHHPYWQENSQHLTSFTPPSHAHGRGRPCLRALDSGNLVLFPEQPTQSIRQSWLA